MQVNIMKIIIMVIICIIFFFYICHHDYLYKEIPKEHLTPEIRHLINFLSIGFYAMGLFLILILRDDLFPEKPYSALSSSDLDEAILTIDSILDEYDDDGWSILYCYFEDSNADDCPSFSDASNAYKNLRSMLDDAHNELSDVNELLRENYIDK